MNRQWSMTIQKSNNHTTKDLMSSEGDEISISKYKSKAIRLMRQKKTCKSKLMKSKRILKNS
jgi:hypothetical protein